MPTYEYECTACGHEFERFESITAEPSRNCPKCRKGKARRRISGGGGLIFKGSGFYCTDYKRSSAKPAKSEPKPCGSSSCEKAMAKGECPAAAAKA
jgi:putative FmdB family regulatory protein